MMRALLPTTLFFSFLLLGLGSCNIINPSEEEPTFVTVEPYIYTAGEDGSNSVKITDGWIYVGGEFLGAFEFPFSIPVLQEGEQQVIIDPGIKTNGIAAIPDIYPFYERYETTINLAKEDVVIKPQTTYKDNAKLVFVENYESGAQRFNNELDGDPETKVVVLEEDPRIFEGDHSGYIYLEESHSLVGVSSSLITEFPSFNSFAFIELDFKTDIPFIIGITGFNGFGEPISGDFSFGINTSEDWNKIYLNIGEALTIARQSGAELYHIELRAQIPIENGEFTRENAEIYLDNVKLILF